MDNAERGSRREGVSRDGAFLVASVGIVSAAWASKFWGAVLGESPAADFVLLAAVGAILLVPAWVFALFLGGGRRAWVYLATALQVSASSAFMLLPAGLGAFFVYFWGIMAFQWPIKFVEWGLFLLAALVALPSGIGAYRALRRGGTLVALRGSWGSRRSVFAVVVTAFFAGSFITSAAGTLQTNPRGADFDFAADAVVEVSTQGIRFVPAQLTLRAGAITEIVFRNPDHDFHDFTYALNGTTYRHDATPQETIRFLVRFPAEGTYDFVCQTHAQQRMTGTFVVAAG